MRVGPLARIVAAASAGFVIGAVLTLQVQGHGAVPGPSHGPSRLQVPPRITPEPPATFLAWTPGGLPTGFGRRAASLAGIDRVTTVRSDNTWLTRSYSSQGRLVDHPTRGYQIPLESAAVDPRGYAAFLPPADRGLTVALANGQGILGSSSAKLRGLGPGAVLEFGRTRVRIAAVLPDELVGANELMVSFRTGARIGVTHPRYALLQPSHLPSDSTLTQRLRRILPRGLRVQVKAPGETPYFRQGDAVLPPVRLKQLFGEFAARPDPRHPGYLLIDPAWVRAHIATERVPVLGRVTCNRAIFPQLRGAMREIRQRGLSRTIHTYDGCYSPRYINRNPRLDISHHAWGVAVDINAGTNPFGAPPHQDLRMVRVMTSWGFTWGGTWVVPDGSHFEYRRPATS